jgi:endonuclease-3 related protein
MGWEDWWPADTPFERVAGAILIQRTRWENVDRAMASLKANGMLSPRALASCPADGLEALIRPAGFYRQKAAYLRGVAEYFSRADIGRIPTKRLREELLGLPGIGDETADVIMLYVAGRPRFIVDAYARRMLECMGVKGRYEELQALAREAFGEDVDAYRRLHAYIVEHGKRHCNKKKCDGCAVKKYLG